MQMSKVMVCSVTLALTLGAGSAALSAAKQPVAVTPADAARRIADVFRDFDRKDSPGCSVGVARDGAVINLSAYGSADLVTGAPLTAQSVFNIGSTSKQFTAFSILLLEQRGKLSIDDLVVKHIPELAASAPSVTLRHLLHHTGGLRDYESLLMLRGRKYSDGETQYEAIAALARQKEPNTPPGLEYVYSNTGYLLLGEVVQRVSGQSLKEFAAENIFRPLGMKHTTIVDRYPANLPNLPPAYELTPQGLVRDDTVWESVGDGQVHATVGDLLLWDENFYTAKVGGRDLIARMQQPGTLDSGKPLDYAAGLVRGKYRGLPLIRHRGSWSSYHAELIRFPEQHFSVAVLCNHAADLEKLPYQVADIYLAGLMSKREPPTPPPARAVPPATWNPGSLSAYTGTFRSEEADNARCDLKVVDDMLLLDICTQDMKVRPSVANTFVSADGTWQIVFEPGPAPSVFRLSKPLLRNLRFTR